MTSAPKGRDDTWSLQEILVWTQNFFAERSITDTPRLDAELLLASVLQCERIYLYTHFDRPLSKVEREAFRALVKRRAAHEPVAYILGEREFFSLAFKVTPDVLVPRPETEHLIEVVLDWAEKNPRESIEILDVGTGSGNIAVTLAKNLPHAKVVAVDVSPAALEIANENARRHEVIDRVSFVESDLFGALKARRFDVVVSNPPYVEESTRDELQADVRDFEPASALFSGDDGLDIIRRLVADLPQHLAPEGLFVCEFGHTQGETVRGLLDTSLPDALLTPIKDLQGHLRAWKVENSQP